MTTLNNTGDFTDLSDFIARAEPGDRYRETQPPHSVSDYLVTEVTEIRGHRAAGWVDAGHAAGWLPGPRLDPDATHPGPARAGR